MASPHSSHDRPAAIIACTKNKRRGTWPAIQLYDASSLFRLSVETARADGLPILILSTKYGLVEPDELLTWYEQPLETMTPDQRRSWEALLSQQAPRLKAKLGVSRVVLFAGRELERAITPILSHAALRCSLHPDWLSITTRAFSDSPT
jgi:hypothetical protein